MSIKKIAISCAGVLKKAASYVFSVFVYPSLYYGMTGYIDYHEVYELSGERCKRIVSQLLSEN